MSTAQQLQPLPSLEPAIFASLAVELGFVPCAAAPAPVTGEDPVAAAPADPVAAPVLALAVPLAPAPDVEPFDLDLPDVEPFDLEPAELAEVDHADAELAEIEAIDLEVADLEMAELEVAELDVAETDVAETDPDPVWSETQAWSETQGWSQEAWSDDEWSDHEPPATADAPFVETSFHDLPADMSADLPVDQPADGHPGAPSVPSHGVPTRQVPSMPPISHG